jgi:photosystem II stability/assembly factor-like uncharacterized protein
MSVYLSKSAAITVLLVLMIAASACGWEGAPEATPAGSPTPNTPGLAPSPTSLPPAPSATLPTAAETPAANPTSPEPTFTPGPDQPPLPGLASITMVDSESGWAITREAGRLLRTADGGLTWQDVTPNGFPAGQVFALDGLTAWTYEGYFGPSSGTSQLFHTADGGLTWDSYVMPGSIDSLGFLDAENGWATGSEMGCGAGSCFLELYRTEDGGQSWEQLQVSSPFGEQPSEFPGTVRIRTGQAFEFSDPDTIWLAGGIWVNQEHGRSALLWVSRDAGTTWQELRVPIPGEAPEHAIPDYVSHPVFITSQEAYFTAAYTTNEADGSQLGYLAFFYSSDGGQTWTARPEVIRTPPYRVAVEFVSVTDIFTQCLEGLCASNDGGMTWRWIDSGLPVSPEVLATLEFVSPSNGWALISPPGVDSELYKTSDGGLNWERLQPTLAD